MKALFIHKAERWDSFRSTRKIFSKSFIDCFRMIMKSYEGYSIRTVKKRYLGSPTNDGRLSLFVPPVMLGGTMGTFHDLRGEIKFVNYCSLGKFFIYFPSIVNTSLKLFKTLFIYFVFSDSL